MVDSVYVIYIIVLWVILFHFGFITSGAIVQLLLLTQATFIAVIKHCWLQFPRNHWISVYITAPLDINGYSSMYIGKCNWPLVDVTFLELFLIFDLALFRINCDPFGILQNLYASVQLSCHWKNESGNIEMDEITSLESFHSSVLHEVLVRHQGAPSRWNEIPNSKRVMEQSACQIINSIIVSTFYSLSQ